MTTEWLLRALAAGVLLGVAALAAERVAGWFGLARRWTWAAAMAGSLLLPALALAAPGALPEIGLPAWGRTTAGAEASASPSTAPDPPVAAGAETAVAAPRPLPRVVRLGWLAASLALLGALAWSQRRLRAACDGCVAARVNGARVLVAERAGPLVLGLLHPEVVLPRWVLDAPAEERALIVRHEREHVRAGDAWLLALAALAVAAMPWSPALWWQHRRLRLAVETDCDARVLAAGASRRAYGHMLLRATAHPFSLPTLALAWGGRASHLERRIAAMTTKPPARRLLRALPLSILALGVAAAACGVAAEGAAPADTRAAPAAAEDPDVASREFPDGTGVMIRRQEPDPSLGYTGLTPYYAERPHEARDGERVARRVESHPVVVGVDPGSPAERAGFRAGDVLLAVNGRDMREPPSERLRPGTELAYRVRRDGRELRLRLTATAPPPQTWPPSDADFERVHQEALRVEESKP